MHRNNLLNILPTQSYLVNKDKRYTKQVQLSMYRKQYVGKQKQKIIFKEKLLIYLIVIVCFNVDSIFS
jgi:hypothetical protein